MSATTVEASRTYPVPVDQAYDAVLAAPLERVFGSWFGPLPAIKRVDGPDAPWGTPGQSRTIRLADGGSMREEITAAERPARFAYRISDVAGPMKALAADVDGEWTFAPAGTGTRVTWRWTITPAGGLGRAAMPVFARLWQGYARQGLERIEGILLPA